MKTPSSMLRHSPTITAALLALALVAMSSALQAQEKGATRQLRLSRTTTAAEVAALPTGGMAVMPCPKCKDVSATVTEKSFKAVQGDVQRTVTTHQCPDCKTTRVVEGHGKAKVEKVKHVCAQSGIQDAVCCVMK